MRADRPVTSCPVSQSSFHHLTAEGGPFFVEKLTDVEVKEQETAAISVTVSSPTAQVVWHKDGAAISEENEQYEVSLRRTRQNQHSVLE